MAVYNIILYIYDFKISHVFNFPILTICNMHKYMYFKNTIILLLQYIQSFLSIWWYGKEAAQDYSKYNKYFLNNNNYLFNLIRCNTLHTV